MTVEGGNCIEVLEHKVNKLRLNLVLVSHRKTTGPSIYIEA